MDRLPSDPDSLAGTPPPETENPQLQLLAGEAQDGDATAFASLLAQPSVRYALLLGWRRFAVRRLHGFDKEEFFVEMVGYVWLRLTARTEDGAPRYYDRTRPLIPWLRKVAFRRACNPLRGPRGQLQVGLNGTETARDASGVEWDDYKEWLTRDLTNRERGVFRLLYEEGWTQKDIAASLGLHKGTVSKIIREMEEKLRQRCEREPPEDGP